MYAKKLKRKCSVRGCNNTDTFAISRASEIGNTVIICKSCLEEALKSVDDIKPVPDARIHHTEAPALFFNHAVKQAPSVDPETETPSVDPETETPSVDPETETPSVDPETSAGFECPYCGQLCKSELGLQRHIESKHKDEM